MKRYIKLQGLVLCGLLSSVCLGASGTLDFWDEAPRLFTTAKDGQDLYHDLQSRQRVGYNSAYFKADHADKRVGDFSIVYDASKAGSAKAFGFVSSLWGDVWELDNQFSLNLFIKVKGSTAAGDGIVSLVDKAGKQAKKSVTVQAFSGLR